MNNTNKLGRGLSSLLGEKKLTINSNLMITDLNVDKVQKIEITNLKPNRLQPRKFFNEDELMELSLSIKQYGILQPIVVRKFVEDITKFEIIAGERRFRAAKIAGLSEVPAIVKDFNDKDVLSLAIIENIQRSDLSVMEEAEAYSILIKDFNYTQQDVANFVGKSRSHIANITRLLSLPEEIREMLYEKKLDMGHARALINCDKAVEIAKIVVEGELNVRETENLVREYNQNKRLAIQSNKKQPSKSDKEFFKKIEEDLFARINLKSKIEFDKNKKKGKITINYNSVEELEKFLNKIQ